MTPSTALSTQSIISLGAVAWAITLPFLPSSVLNTLRNPIATFVLLAIVLAALQYGPVTGVLVLAAVLLTFVERNRLHIKNSLLNKATGEEATYEKQLAPSAPMSPNEVHPSPVYAETESMDYMPHEETGMNQFEGVGESIDEKNVVQTISSTPEMAAKFFVGQGLGATELRG